MASNDKLHNRFRGEEALPDDLSWDSVGDAIYDGVLAVDGERPWWLRYRLLIALLLLISVGGSIAVYQYGPLYDQAEADNIKVVDSNPGKQYGLTETPPSVQNMQTENNGDGEAEVGKHRARTKQGADHTLSSERAIDGSSDVGASVNEDIRNSAASIRQYAVKGQTLLSGSQVKDDNLLVDFHSKRIASGSPESVDGLESIGFTQPNYGLQEGAVDLSTDLSYEDKRINTLPLSGIAVRVYPLITEDYDLTKDISVEASSITKPSNVRSRLSIALESGSSLWTGYGSGLGVSEPYTETAPSLHTSLLAEVQLTSKLLISAGIRYRRLEDRLDYYEEQDVLAPGVVTIIETNALTGSVSSRSEERLLPTVSKRTIVHHNSTQLITLPISVAREWVGSSPWSIRLGVGAEFVLFHNRSGAELIANGDTGFYDRVAVSDSDYAGASRSVLGTINGAAGYRITPRLSLTAGFRLSKSLASWSPSANVSPSIVDASVGVSMSW